MRKFKEIMADLKSLEVESDGNHGTELVHVSGWYPHADGIQSTQYRWVRGVCYQRETILTVNIGRWNRLFDELVDSIEI